MALVLAAGSAIAQPSSPAGRTAADRVVDAAHASFWREGFIEALTLGVVLDSYLRAANPGNETAASAAANDLTSDFVAWINPHIRMRLIDLYRSRFSEDELLRIAEFLESSHGRAFFRTWATSALELVTNRVTEQTTADFLATRRAFLAERGLKD